MLHYWLFGFHKDGYFDRFKSQQYRHNKLKKNMLKQMRINASHEFSQHSQNEIESNSNGGVNALFGDNTGSGGNKLIKSMSAVHGSNNNSLNNSNNPNAISLANGYPYHGINDIPHLSIDSMESHEPMDGININNSISPVYDNRRKSHNRNKSSNKSKKRNKYGGGGHGGCTGSAISVGLTSDLTGISSNTLSARSSPYNSLYNKSFMGFRYPESKILKWISLYCIIQMCVNATFTALSNVQNKWYKEYFVQIFLFILISTSILKWIMKRIARMIDASRGTHPATSSKSRSKQNRNKIGSKSVISHDPLSNLITDQLQNKQAGMKTYISLELCTELYMDFVFFLAYRELMMYYIPDISEFFKVSIYFFVHEVWICSLRPSTLYYRLSACIQNMGFSRKLVSCVLCNNLRDGKNHNYDDERSDLSENSGNVDIYRSVDPEILKKRLLFFNWRDDSTLIQWQIRCSLDVTMRILAGVISSITIIVEVLVLGAGYFDLERQDWITGMEYIGLSAGIHLGYFALIYIWNFKLMAFPLLEPWWSLQKSNEKTWKFVCVALMVISFWLPDL